SALRAFSAAVWTVKGGSGGRCSVMTAPAMGMARLSASPHAGSNAAEAQHRLEPVIGADRRRVQLQSAAALVQDLLGDGEAEAGTFGRCLATDETLGQA